MKYFYSIPNAFAAKTKKLCDEYVTQLKSWSEESINTSDALREYLKSTSAPFLQLDDEDWNRIKEAIKAKGSAKMNELIGEIYWSVEDGNLFIKEIKFHKGAELKPVSSWLSLQLDHQRSIVLLNE